MTDRGTHVAAVDVAAVDADAFQHAQDTTADFGLAVAAILDVAPDAEIAWTHTSLPPADFGGAVQLTNGTGWYMTEAVSTDKKLQGAPNGSAQATGTFQVDMALTATVVARSTVSSPAMAKAVALQATSNGGSTATLNLRVARALVGQAAGVSTVVGDLSLRQVTALSGQPAGSSTVAADLTVHTGQQFALVAQVGGTSSVVADLTLPPFEGSATGHATATAVVTVTYAFNITGDQSRQRARFYTAR